MEPFVRLENINKRYGRVIAADNVCLDIYESEFVTLLGPSGSGKSTVLMTLAGFVKADSGRIFVKGKDISQIPPYRRDMGLVFQNYALFPHMTVFDNIAYPLKMRRVQRAQIRDSVRRVLDLVKLFNMDERHPAQLSGGQQQRVAVARALVFEPSILLMDEPLGALDKKLRDQMQLELKNLQQKLGITVLYVTHDQGEALSMSTKIVIMKDGRIEQVGTGLEIYEHPTDNFVCDFLGEVNSFKARVERIESDRIHVASAILGNLHAKLRHRAFKPDQEIFFTIRPEKIFLMRTDDESQGGPEGTVEDIIYLGDITKYYIRLAHCPDDPNSGRALVHVQNRITNQTFTRGDRVRITWNEEDAMVVACA
jgi:putative spermidine/putrescine transport system ATP-binding protein